MLNLGQNLSIQVRKFVDENVKICQPSAVHICDGSEQENTQLCNELIKEGIFKKLTKFENCYLALSDPADVARVESKTVIASTKKSDTIPTPKDGVKGWFASHETFTR